MRSYCMRQKKVTECVPGSETYVRTKNGRNMMKCKCAECGITKTKFVKSTAGKDLILGKHSAEVAILGAILQSIFSIIFFSYLNIDEILLRETEKSH